MLASGKRSGDDASPGNCRLSDALGKIQPRHAAPRPILHQVKPHFVDVHRVKEVWERLEGIDDASPRPESPTPPTNGGGRSACAGLFRELPREFLFDSDPKAAWLIPTNLRAITGVSFVFVAARPPARLAVKDMASGDMPRSRCTRQLTHSRRIELSLTSRARNKPTARSRNPHYSRGLPRIPLRSRFASPCGKRVAVNYSLQIFGDGGFAPHQHWCSSRRRQALNDDEARMVRALWSRTAGWWPAVVRR